MEAARIEIVHHVPGRLRLRVSGVKSDHAAAGVLEDRLRQICGIRAVRANPLTGSVLIHYERSQAASVLHALNVRRPARETREISSVTQLAGPPAADLASAIARYALRKAFQTALEIAIQKSVLLLIAAVL